MNLYKLVSKRRIMRWKTNLCLNAGDANKKKTIGEKTQIYSRQCVFKKFISTLIPNMFMKCLGLNPA